MEIKTKQVLRVQNIKSLKGTMGSIKHSFNLFKRDSLLNVESKFTKENLVWNNGEISKAGNENYKIIKGNIEQELEPFKVEWEERQLQKKPFKRISFEKKIGSKDLKLEEDKNSPVLFQEWVLGIGNIEVYKEIGVVDFEEVEYEAGVRKDKLAKHKITKIIDKEKVKKYFEVEMKEFIFNFKKNTGKEPKIMGATLHLDEASPHIHIITSTLTREFTKTANKEIYKNKNIINPDTLHKMQETRDHNIGEYLRKNKVKGLQLEKRQVKVKWMEKKVLKKMEKEGLIPKDKIHTETKLGYQDILAKTEKWLIEGAAIGDQKQTKQLENLEARLLDQEKVNYSINSRNVLISRDLEKANDDKRALAIRICELEVENWKSLTSSDKELYIKDTLIELNKPHNEYENY